MSKQNNGLSSPIPDAKNINHTSGARKNENNINSQNNSLGSLFDMVVPLNSAPVQHNLPQVTNNNNNKEVNCQKEKQEEVSEKIYTIRQFQNNLGRAIVAKDIKRFRRLLRKYKECCRNNTVVNNRGEVPVWEVQYNNNYIINNNSNNKSLLSDSFSDNKRSLVDEVADFTTGYTIMHLAVISGISTFVENCIEFGSKVHSYEDLNGDTALSLAIYIQPQVVFKMMQFGKDINIARVNMRGHNLLHNAVTITSETALWPERKKFIKGIIRKDPKMILVKDPFGFTPAMWAAEHMHNFSSKEEALVIIKLLKPEEVENNVKSSDELSPKKIKYKKLESHSRDINEKLVNKKIPILIPTVHYETHFSDRFRFIFEGPVTRLLCIILLIGLHIIAYAMNIADRGVDAQYRNAEFKFWFTIFNNIGSCWNGSSFYMGLTHVACSFIAAIIGAIIYRFGIHLFIGKIIMRLPICGAVSYEEEFFLRESFGGFYFASYKVENRGSLFAILVGGILGVYSGAKIYNICLHHFWPGQISWGIILSSIDGIDTITGLRNLWVTALFLDWYIFTFVFDIMYQQGSLNIYLPHHIFSNFAASINTLFRNRKPKLVEKDIYTVRMVIYWILLLLGWIIIAVVFTILEFIYAPAKEFFINPIISVSWLGTPIFIASLCILLECIIASQEWTWPTFQEHPFLQFPGFIISTHHAWFLMLILLIEASLDIRIIVEHIELLQQQEKQEGGRGELIQKDIIIIAISLVPAMIGIIALIFMIIRTSLWWSKCKTCGRAIQLYSEHTIYFPCPLQNKEAELLAKRVDIKEATQLSRTLACEAASKHCKERIQIGKAIKELEKQFQEEESWRESGEVNNNNNKNKKKKKREKSLNNNEETSHVISYSSSRRTSLWNRVRGRTNNNYSDNESEISIISDEDEVTPHPVK